MRPLVATLLVLATCASAPVHRDPQAQAPRVALVRFLDALDGHDMTAAWDQLSGRWRAQLTPERLERDLLEGGELARDRLARARAAASTAEPRVEGATAAFPIGDGRSVRLVLEDAAWKVDALE